MLLPNQALEPTAAARSVLIAPEFYFAAVASAGPLPAAVAQLGRWATSDV